MDSESGKEEHRDMDSVDMSLVGLKMFGVRVSKREGSRKRKGGGLGWR